MGKGSSWIAMLAGFGAWFVARYYFRVPFDLAVAGVLAAVLAIVIGYPLGWIVGHFVARDADVDATSYRVAAGANLLAWLIPAAGFAVSAITWQFSRRSDTAPTFYAWLSCIGGLLALASAGVGGAQEMKRRQAAFTIAQTSRVPVTTVHSPERCPYAAIEAWPTTDFERYCRHPH